MEDEISFFWMGGERSTGNKQAKKKQTLKRILSNTTTIPVYGYFPELLPDIRPFFAQTHRLNRELYLFSDFQNSGFPMFSDSLNILENPLSVFVLPVRNSTENVAILSGGLASQILHPKLPFRIYADIQNFGMQPVEALWSRVFINGKAAAQQCVQLEAGEKKRVEFRIFPESSGPVSGQIVIDDDLLSWDNSFYFTGVIPEQIHVSLVGKNSSDVHPVARALSALHGESGLFQVRTFIQGQNQ